MPSRNQKVAYGCLERQIHLGEQRNIRSIPQVGRSRKTKERTVARLFEDLRLGSLEEQHSTAGFKWQDTGRMQKENISGRF